jgi:hypothetical protein
MSRIRPKQPRLRLDAQSYLQLCREVLQRDGWRCQACGTTSNLEVHHRKDWPRALAHKSSQRLVL